MARRAGWAGAAVLAAALPWGVDGVAGQDSPPSADSVVPIADSVVVRALRTPLPRAALPFSVSLRTLEDRPPAAGLTLATALRTVPGLQVHSRYNEALGERIMVRGFGARAQFGIRGVHVLVDGIPATMPDGQTTLNHLDLTRLARAEVLRGPAAAAYGNAAGGVLLLETTSPPSRGFHPLADVTVGSDGLVRTRIAAGRGGEASGWTTAVSRETRDGFRAHAASQRWQLTGRYDAPLAGGHLRIVTHGVAYDADNPGSLTPAQFEADPTQAQAFNVTQGTGEEGRHGQAGVAWERVAGKTVVETAAWGLTRALENPIPPAIIDLDRVAVGARALVRGGAGGRGAVAWAAGLDGGVLRDDRRTYDNDAGARGDRTLDQEERVATVAVHGQAILPLGPRLGLFLAARYDRVRFAATDRLVTAADPDDSGDRTMDALSPTAGVRFRPLPGLSLFANVATAFETPTTTELVNRPDGAGGFNPELEPQRTVSYEAGVRATPSANVELEASVYHAFVSEALVPFEVASAPGRQYFRNAASAVHRGVEVLVGIRAGSVGTTASYARTDASFASYASADAVHDGRTVPGVRPWTAGLTVLWNPDAPLHVEVGAEITAEMPVDDANTTAAPGYALLNLRADSPEGARLGRWRLLPYAGIDNLLDATYVASVVPNAFGGRYFEPGPGRSVYVGVRLAPGPD